MFKYAVNCALEPVSASWPAVLRGSIEENISAAAGLGYDGVELFVRNPRGLDAALITRLSADAGIGFAAVSTGLEFQRSGHCMIDESPMKRAAAVDQLKTHADLAGELGCCLVLGIIRGNIPDLSKSDIYLGYLAEGLLELSEYTAPLGVDIVVEAITRYVSNYLCSAGETADYIRRLGRENIGIHIDSHHMNVEERDIEKAVISCGDLLKYVHFSDTNRAYPGGGAFDFKTMMKAMMDIGYRGYVTIECLPLPSPFECAKRGLYYMKHLQALLEIERMPLEAL